MRKKYSEFTIEEKEKVKSAVKKYRQTEKGKESDRKAAKKYRDNHKNKVKEWDQKRNHKRTCAKHGLTVEDYEKILISQNGVCAICGKQEIDIHPQTGKIKNLSIDHNHLTEQNRGLLCRKCNWFISKCDENINILDNAIKYLEKYNVTE